MNKKDKLSSIVAVKNAGITEMLNSILMLFLTACESAVCSVTTWWQTDTNWIILKPTFCDSYILNGLYALVSCLPLLAKLINSGVSDYYWRDYWGQAHLN